jgi:hypothetical protein
VPLVPVIATLVFRVLGAAGVRRFATWTPSLSHGLGRVSWIFDGGWDRPLLWLVVMI